VDVRVSMALFAEGSEPLSRAMVMRLLVWWAGRDDSLFDVYAEGSRTLAMTVMF
jgi:hypothetical protein